MSFFRFYNADWSHLPQATPLPQGGWAFADDVRLSVLLHLTPEQIDRVRGLSVDCLRLTISRRHALFISGTTSLGLLLDSTLFTLLKMPYMGYVSVLEILDQLFRLAESPTVPEPEIRSPEVGSPEVGGPEVTAPPLWTLRRAAPYVPARPEDLEPLTLGREWELFSGLPSCDRSLLLAQAGLPDETGRRLQELGFVYFHELLDRSVADLSERLGDDAAEGVLGAVVLRAAEARVQPDAGGLLRWARERDRAAVLAERWAGRPVSELKLTDGAGKALRRAGIATVSELLAALEPLHSELAHDPFALAAVWKALLTAGLRDEAGAAAGERLRAEAYTRVTLQEVVAAWRAAVPPRHWAIISARLGLEGGPSPWRAATLDEVAKTCPLTRERVRQIEVRFVKRLIDRKDRHFFGLSNTLRMITAQAGGVISFGQAVEDLSRWVNPGGTAAEGFCCLIFNNSPTFTPIKRNSIYALTARPVHLYRPILDAARRVMAVNFKELSQEELAEEVEKLARRMLPAAPEPGADGGPPTRRFVAACLAAAGGFQEGFFVPPAAALVRLLRELGGPRHFTELADRLAGKKWRMRPITAGQIHGCLLSDLDLFVYVSPGTYGLAEWGLEDQRTGNSRESIGDLIAGFLQGRSGPASKEEITEHVLLHKECFPSSVANKLLYDGRFRRLDGYMYGLSE